MKSKLLQFKRYLTAIVNGYEAMGGDADAEDKKVCIEHARWAYKRCVALFDDRNENLRRWLDGESCVYKDPITGTLTEVMVGDANESIVYFLEFCRRQNGGMEIDDDFAEYLAYLIKEGHSSQKAKA